MPTMNTRLHIILDAKFLQKVDQFIKPFGQSRSTFITHALMFYMRSLLKKRQQLVGEQEQQSNENNA